MAIERNRGFLAAKARISETEALLRQAGVRPTPTIEVEGATGRLAGSPGESAYSAAYFHTFETGNKRGRRIDVALQTKSAAEAEVEERRRELSFQIKLKYAQAVAEQLKLEAVNELIPLNRQNYDMTARRVELGDAAPLEQQLLLTDIRRAEAQQATLTSRVEAALAELKSAAGFQLTDRLPIERALTMPDRELVSAELQTAALQNRPDLRLLKVLEAQTIAEAEQAKSEGRPDITGSARYARISSRFDQFGLSESGALVPVKDSDNIVTFGVSIPLFSKKRVEGTVGAANARVTQVRLQRENLEQVIPLEVEAALRRLSGARRTLNVLQTGVIDQSARNLDVMREAYGMGQLKLFDVLNEQRKLAETRLAFVDAQLEVAQAWIELEKAVGGTLQ
jgi:cobalt-zinc-cadmium efflux system outer membrane protein